MKKPRHWSYHLEGVLFAPSVGLGQDDRVNAFGLLLTSMFGLIDSAMLQ